MIINNLYCVDWTYALSIGSESYGMIVDWLAVKQNMGRSKNF